MAGTDEDEPEEILAPRGGHGSNVRGHGRGRGRGCGRGRASHA